MRRGIRKKSRRSKKTKRSERKRRKTRYSLELDAGRARVRCYPGKADAILVDQVTV